MKAKPLLFGMIVGGIASGIATLLTTPRSGKELRENLINAEIEWSINLSTLKNCLLDLKNEINTVSQEGKEVFSSLLKDLNISVKEWKESTEENQHRLKTELQSIQDSIENLELDIKKK